MQAQLLQHPAPASSCRTSAPFGVRHEVHGPVPRCEGKRVRVVDRGVLFGSWKAPVVCRSAIQHYSRSHLDDEFIAMQQALQQAMGQPEGTSHSGTTGLRTAAHPHHGHHHHAGHSSHSSSGHAHDTHEHHASRGSRSEAAGAASTTTMASPHAMHSHHSVSVAPPHTSVDAAPPPRVCSLGGPHDDPILTMQLLRAALHEYSSAVLKVHGSQPGVLLDAVAMLHLLNQELGRGAGPHLMFKPLDTSRPRHTTPASFVPTDADAAPLGPGTTVGASAAAATSSATPPSAAAAPAVATAATAISPAADASSSAPSSQRPAAAVSPAADTASSAPSSQRPAVAAAADAASTPSSQWPATASEEPPGGRDIVLLLQRIPDPAALLHPVPTPTTTAPRHPSGGGEGGGDSGVGSSRQAAQGAGGGDGSYNGSDRQAAQEAGSGRQQGEGGGGDGGDGGDGSSRQAAQGTGGSTLQRGDDASGGGSAMLASGDETTPASAVAKSFFASHSPPLAAPVLSSAAAAHIAAAASVGDCAPPSASSASPASPLSPAPSSPASSPSSRASPLSSSSPSSTSSPASHTSALSSPPSTSPPSPTSPHLPPSLPSAPPHASASEAWQLAHALADQLQEQRMCVQLRCEGPLKLGTAFKALKRARRLLRHQANMDMLVAPLITSDAGGHSICFNCYPTQDVASEDVQGTL